MQPKELDGDNVVSKMNTQLCVSLDSNNRVTLNI